MSTESQPKNIPLKKEELYTIKISVKRSGENSNSTPGAIISDIATPIPSAEPKKSTFEEIVATLEEDSLLRLEYKLE